MPRAFLLVLVAAAALAPIGATATRHGHVRLLTSAPLVVRGSGFKAHEKVVVTAQSGTSKRVATVTSSAAGGFTAQFARALPVPHCGSVSVTAVGSRGDTAAWKSPPQVCGTQLAP